MAVVMVSLVLQHGVEYLFATVILMGVLQLLFAAFKLGKFIRMVPHSVMLGFVNGLAIVVFMAQLGQLVLSMGATTAVQLLVQAAAIIIAVTIRHVPALFGR